MKREIEFHRKKAEEFVRGLSLSDKFTALCGTGEEYASIGLPRFDTGGEAAHGVQARHDQSFDLGEPDYTTIFPNPIGMAATWDKELLYAIGEVVGTEARSLHNEGRSNSLCFFAPTVDLERDPRWGRNEEAYGEDPILTSRMAGSYIRGMAGEDKTYVRAGAMLKHFYANNVELDRSLKNSEIPEHLKDEYYLKVYKELAEYAQPLSVMTSYNYVNGVPSTFNPEVRKKLKAWGILTAFCDGGALSMTVEKQHAAESYDEAVAKALNAGLDGFLDDPKVCREGAKAAYEKGLLSEETIDRALINRITVYSMLGLMEPENAPFGKENYNMSKVNTAEGRRLSRRASAESMVLLKNEGAAPVTEKEVFLFGPFADRAPLDWYSGINDQRVTIQQGMEAAYSVRIAEPFYPTVRIKLSEEQYAGLDQNKLVPVAAEQAEKFTLMLWDHTRVTLRAKSTGKLLTSRPLSEKTLNSEERDRGMELHAYPEEAFSWFVDEAFCLCDAGGEEISFTPEDALHFWEDSRIAGMKNNDGYLKLTFETVTTPETLLENTIKKIGDNIKNGQAVYCFGLHPMVNGKEERDRLSIELPPYQRAVLRMLEEHFEGGILLLCCNSPVACEEEQNSDKISSIFWAPFGSEEYGNGVADVLSGKQSPAGCLPQTWYKGDADLPDINDYEIDKNEMTYLYMKNKKPLYRFGYGLGYSNVKQQLFLSGNGKLRVMLTNTGDRATDAVVQLYQNEAGEYALYDDALSCGYRLVDFGRVKELMPGEKRELVFGVSGQNRK